MFDNLYGDNENKSCNVYCCNWYLFGPFKGGGLNKFIEYNIVWMLFQLLSLYKSNRMSVSESVCLNDCSLTPPKRINLMSWNFEEWFPWDADGFRLKNIRICRFGRKIEKLERVHCCPLWSQHSSHIIVPLYSLLFSAVAKA